ncbi:MAG: LysM peptidoglycan-binding domain-containing protein, partial [Aggregatilineales bacterium]
MKLAVLWLVIFCLSAFAAFAQEQTTYTIQRGDTLFRIAQRYNVSMADLMAANNITNPSRIFAGTVLIIPGAAPAAAPQPVVDAVPSTDAPTQTVTHVVARGESLSMIARSYGVSMNAIIAANNIRNPNTIFAGQRLIIPGANPAVMEAVAAAAPAPVAQSAPDAPAGYIGSHVVRPGETLSLIARRYNVSWTALALANGIADPNRIEAGTTLRIPSNDGRIVAAQGDP